MNHTHMLIRIPKDTGRTEAVMEACLADIHRQLLSLKGPPENRTIALELVLHHTFLYFYMSASEEAAHTVAGQFYAHFPGVELEYTADYICAISPQPSLLSCDLRLEKNDMYPIKTYPLLGEDSLLGYSGVFSKMTEQECTCLQVILTPMIDTWNEQGKRYINHMFHITYESKEGYAQTLKKFEKLYFASTIRLAVSAQSDQIAKQHHASFIHAFSQFDHTAINSFLPGTVYQGEKAQNLLQSRFPRKAMRLNIEELSSIYHFPPSPAIAHVIRVLSRKAEPPPNLPNAEFLKDPDISTFANTDFRNDAIPFGIKRIDRRRHLYVVGKTGMGKSKLLELLMLSDIYSGHGFAVLDPHGDLAEQILRYIPQKRIKDVIYFNPADEQHPMGFNPLEVSDRTYYQQVVTGFLAIFKKLFIVGWTPRLEHMLRFITLALLETKDATVVDIPRLLTDKSFRQDVIAQIQDPVVKNFWTHEFASWNEKYDNEAIVPILNKVSEFISSPLIRNTLGQKKSSFQMSDIMDQNKILIANVSSGKLGEENSALLGSMIVTQIQQAAMSRANLSEEQRKDFLLYVDEFQNFATSAFTTILSEARKYRLSLTIAHQYINQLDPGIQKTVFGNIGSLVVFRVGAEDAKVFATELSPVFTAEDLMNLDARHMAVKLAINGATAPPFSAATITLPKLSYDWSKEIIQHCQAAYTQTLEHETFPFQKVDSSQSPSFLFDEQNKPVSNFDEPII